MLTVIESGLAGLALIMALSLRPWRMLSGALLTPVLASVVLLPWLWLLPQSMPQGLQIQLSGACLLVLMLGWPLAVGVLVSVSLLVWGLGHADASAALSQGVWIGLVPATLSLGIGAALRRWLPPNPFVYTLGRAFMGTAFSVFVSGWLLELLQGLVGTASPDLSLVARWLMAWGDAFLTGMFSAIFVAFAPQWLATWSDQRYLQSRG
jgi:uncharacterized membrane protein